MDHTSNKAYKRVKQRPFNAIKTDTIILQKCTFVYVHKYIYSTATVLQKKVLICTKNVLKIKQNVPIKIKRYKTYNLLTTNDIKHTSFSAKVSKKKVQFLSFLKFKRC